MPALRAHFKAVSTTTDTRFTKDDSEQTLLCCTRDSSVISSTRPLYSFQKLPVQYGIKQVLAFISDPNSKSLQRLKLASALGLCAQNSVDKSVTGIK